MSYQNDDDEFVTREELDRALDSMRQEYEQKLFILKSRLSRIEKSSDRKPKTDDLSVPGETVAIEIVRRTMTDDRGASVADIKDELGDVGFSRTGARMVMEAWLESGLLEGNINDRVRFADPSLSEVEEHIEGSLDRDEIDPDGSIGEGT